MGKFLIALSGARSDILNLADSDRIKFQSLGWAILITSGMATISMWFALTSAMGFSAVMSLPIALVWGLVIMGIDRWLVTSMPVDGGRKFAVALPRLLLALLLGSLISTPIVLRIFQSEINNQISLIKAQRENAYLTSQQHGALVAQINQWTTTVNNLRKVIDSGGLVTINPPSDPQWQLLNRQKTQEQALVDKDYREWQCQLYGIYKGVKCPKGNGPLAEASHQAYLKAQAQVDSYTQQMADRVNQLSQNDQESQAQRLQQAKTDLPNATEHLRVATQENDALQADFSKSNNSTNGLLIRLQALDQLSASNPTLRTAQLLLFLLFLVIECLPVSVKLLTRPGNYEQVLGLAKRQELNKANRHYRDDPGFSQGNTGDLPQIPDLADMANPFQPPDPRIAKMARHLQGGPARRAPRQAPPDSRVPGRNPASASPGGKTTPYSRSDRVHDGHSIVEDGLQYVFDTRGANGFTRGRGVGISGLDADSGDVPGYDRERPRDRDRDSDDGPRYGGYGSNEL